MNTIVRKEEIAPNTFRYVIRHPKLARKRQAGQFVILRIHEGGERVPLTIVDSDPEAGTVTLIFQAVGHSTQELAELGVGDKLLDLDGEAPLADNCFDLLPGIPYPVAWTGPEAVRVVRVAGAELAT